LRYCISHRQTRQLGYVITILGRRRYLPDITSADAGKRGTAERQAINSVVQGSASDIIKLAMLSVEKALGEQSDRGGAEVEAGRGRSNMGQDTNGGDDVNYGHGNSSKLPQARLLLQIHDELIYEVPLLGRSDAHMIEGNSSSIDSDGGADDPNRASSLSVFVDALRECMERRVAQALGFAVPLTVNISTGTDWGSMTDWS
jgi:DNA polymerase I-like protein with 3'-5' exonuclease and polymerase domains